MTTPNPWPERVLTRPWAEDEYAKYNGYSLIYHVTHNGIVVVHIPGGAAKNSNELPGLMLPKKLRRN